MFRLKSFLLTRKLTEKECLVKIEKTNSVFGSKIILLDLMKKGKLKHHFPIFKIESTVIGVNPDDEKFRGETYIKEVKDSKEEKIECYSVRYEVDRGGFTKYFYYKKIILEVRVNDWFITKIDLTDYFQPFRKLVGDWEQINDFIIGSHKNNDNEKVSNNLDDIESLDEVKAYWEKCNLEKIK